MWHSLWSLSFKMTQTLFFYDVPVQSYELKQGQMFEYDYEKMVFKVLQ